MNPRPNHALQRTWPSRSGCDLGIPRAGSLSLGRYASMKRYVPTVGATGIVLVGLVLGIRYLELGPADSIDQAHLDTQSVLRGYLRSGNPGPARHWLVTYHGEAPGSQVMYTFVGWAARNPTGAENIVAGLSGEETKRLAERVGWAAVDSDQHLEFDSAFRSSSSPFFRSAINHATQFAKAVRK
jgi:hypothetical protein